MAYKRGTVEAPRMGFPEGVAEQLVLKHFRAFPSKDYSKVLAGVQVQSAPTPKINNPALPKMSKPATAPPKPRVSAAKLEPQPTATATSEASLAPLAPLSAQEGSPPAPPPSQNFPTVEPGATAEGGENEEAVGPAAEPTISGRITGVSYAPSGKQVLEVDQFICHSMWGSFVRAADMRIVCHLYVDS